MARSQTRNRLSTGLRARLHFAARFAVAVMLSSFLVMSEQQRAAVAQALSDPMSVLSARSPGERQHGALRPSKVRHEVKLPKGEKLLSDSHVVDHEELAGEPGFFAEQEPATLPAQETLPGTGKAPVGEMPAIAHGGGGRGSFGGVGGGAVGGGGGGGSGGGGGEGGGDESHCQPGAPCGEGSTVPTGDPVPPTILEVPEPSTWAMALIGFFTLGAMIRRTKPAAARARAAARQPRAD